MVRLIVGLLLAAVAVGAQPMSTMVTGRVVDGQTNEPLAGAEIVFLPADLATRQTPPSAPIRSQTNGRGAFNLDVPSGRYRIQVRHGGFIDNGMSVTPITIDGATLSLPDLRLERGAAIEGRVVDAKGRPLAGVVVFALRQLANLRPGAIPGLPVASSGPSDDRGQFRLAGLPPGMYFVVGRPLTQSSGAMMFVSTYHPDATDVALARSIDVTAGSTTVAINIQLQQAPTTTVSGVVVDRADRPVGGAVVSFMSADIPSGIPARATSRSDGTFRITVPTGMYRVVASTPVIMPAGGASTSSFGITANQGVEVKVEDWPVSGIKVVADRR